MDEKLQLKSDNQAVACRLRIARAFLILNLPLSYFYASADAAEIPLLLLKLFPLLQNLQRNETPAHGCVSGALQCGDRAGTRESGSIRFIMKAFPMIKTLRPIRASGFGMLFLMLASCTQGDGQPDPFGSFKTSLQDAVSKMNLPHGLPGMPGTHGKSVDSVGLRNILPEYDRGQPLSKQFPHIAIKVLKSPPNWTQGALGSSAASFHGCWTLQARVWSSSKASKVVGPFDWCMPDDLEFTMGPMGIMGYPMPLVMDYGYVSMGNNRTGPRPPKDIMPNGRHMTDVEMTSGMQGTLSSDQLYGTTVFGNMVANLRKQLGATMDTSQGRNSDLRVWIESVD